MSASAAQPKESSGHSFVDDNAGLHEVGWGFQYSRKTWVIAASLSVMSVFSAAVVRAAPDEASSNATFNGTSDQLTEIVVTAQKRTERLQDVPVAVTALNADDLIARNDVSVNDYFRRIPGVALFDNGEGFKQIVIRGITTGTGDTPAVGTYIDEIPIGSSTALARGDVLLPDLDPSDLQQVEVLKGPQGTLYGANNMGGLLKYVTKLPNLTTFSGHFETDGTTVDHGGTGYGVRGSVNIPLVTDAVALRLSGSTREDPGFINNAVTGARDVNTVHVDNGRADLLWQASADLRVRVTGLIQERRADGSNRVDYDGNSGQPYFGNLEQGAIPGTGTDREQLEVLNSTTEWNFGPGVLTSSSSFSRNSYSGHSDLSPLFGPLLSGPIGIPDLGATIDQSFDTDKFTQELRVASNAGGVIDWLGGLFYTHEASNANQFINPADATTGQFIPGLPVFGVAKVPSRYEEMAGFGDITYHVTTQFDVQGGLRYSYNDQRSQTVSKGILTTAGTSTATAHQGVTTFLVTPEYKFNDDAMVYARIASGYRPGGPNTIVVGAPEAPYKADYTTNYELGSKFTFFEHRAYVDFDVYYIAWRDIQLLGIDALHNEFFINAGKASSKGLEFSGQIKPIEGLTLAANLSYTDAHLIDAAPPTIVAPAGSQLPYSPKSSGLISADYDFPLRGAWYGDVGGDYSYFGGRESDFAASPATPRLTLPSYGLGNFRAGLRYDRYKVNLFVKNVADTRGFTSADTELLRGIGRVAYTVVQPRTVGLSVEVAL
jgi:iron complex outermembrane recepter protein